MGCKYEPLLRNQICIIFHQNLPWFTSEYHLRIMFDHIHCQNVHSQSQNCCFKEMLIFSEKYLSQSVRLLFGRMLFEHALSLSGASLTDGGNPPPTPPSPSNVCFLWKSTLILINVTYRKWKFSAFIENYAKNQNSRWKLIITQHAFRPKGVTPSPAQTAWNPRTAAQLSENLKKNTLVTWILSCNLASIS